MSSKYWQLGWMPLRGLKERRLYGRDESCRPQQNSSLAIVGEGAGDGSRVGPVDVAGCIVPWRAAANSSKAKLRMTVKGTV